MTSTGLFLVNMRENYRSSLVFGLSRVHFKRNRLKLYGVCGDADTVGGHVSLLGAPEEQCRKRSRTEEGKKGRGGKGKKERKEGKRKEREDGRE